jgi:hypothetical protein
MNIDWIAGFSGLTEAKIVGGGKSCRMPLFFLGLIHAGPLSPGGIRA